MKRFRKITGILLMLALMLVLFPAKSNAAENIQPDRPVTLTITDVYAEKALEDVEYRLYKVAAYQENGGYTLTEAFRQYPVALDNPDTDTSPADTLMSYVQRDSLTPDDSGRTNVEGIVRFPTSGNSMYPGLYLLIHEPLAKDGYTYETSPILLSLPNADESETERNYDVNVFTKSVQKRPEKAVTERSVVKQWAGDSEQTRPSRITVQLLCNGSIYDTAELSAESGWQYTWKDLPEADNNGAVNQWSVTEKEVEGYTVKITLEDTVFRITNTSVNVPKTPEKDKEIPETGLLWWPIPVLAFLGLVSLMIGLRLKKRQA